MRFTRLLFTFFILFMTFSLFSTTFTNTNASIDNMLAGSLEFGDYNNDGFIDLYMSGFRNSSLTNYQSSIYSNSNGTFSLSGIELPGLCLSTSIWGDYDNDGDLDLFISGYSDFSNSELYSSILRNDDGVFTEIESMIVPIRGDSELIDYDNDGDLDLLTSGYTADDHYFVRLYENDNNNFSDCNIVFPDIDAVDIQAIDINNDSLMDFIITGTDSLSCNTSVFINNGGTFDINDIAIMDLCLGSVDWGDYDNDGDADLGISGLEGIEDDDEAMTRIYQNNEGILLEIDYDIQGTNYGDIAWGDYDNDGNLDLVVSGRESNIQPSVPYSAIYRNENGQFTEETYNIYDLWTSSSQWCDYDNDGDLDLAINGRGNSPSPISRLYRNDDTTPNNIPTSPTNLRISEEGEYFKFEWDMASDVEQPDVSLTYEVRIGSTPGGCEIVSPMALPDGRALKPAFGRINSNCFYLIKSSVFAQDQTYYWSCQAIDNSFTRSPFATEQAFTYQSVGNNDEYSETVPLLTIKSVYPNPANLDSPIKIELENSDNNTVSASVYNIRGQVVCEIVQNEQIADTKAINWNGTDSIGKPVSNGIYFLKVVAGNETRSQKIMIVK